MRLRVAPGAEVTLRDRMPVHFHLGAADITGRVQLLEEVGARDAGLVEEGFLASILLDAPVVAVRGDRFVLRDQSATRTLAGGLVLEPVGVYPGSLGNYGGLQMKLPVITIELREAGRLPPAPEVQRMWSDMRQWMSRQLPPGATAQSTPAQRGG